MQLSRLVYFYFIHHLENQSKLQKKDVILTGISGVRMEPASICRSVATVTSLVETHPMKSVALTVSFSFFLSSLSFLLFPCLPFRSTLILKNNKACDPNTHWTCADGSCIGIRLFNDGIDDCYDGSDEFSRSKTGKPISAFHFLSSFFSLLSFGGVLGWILWGG